MFRPLSTFCPSATALRRAKSFACAQVAVLLLLMTVAAPQARAQQADGFQITGVNLAGFQIVGNVLKATGSVNGTLAGLPFTTQITDFTLQLVPDDPTTAVVECSVLNLELGPIHLDLLGLHVDTSAICLEITATPGGGLLGDLLCALAGGGPLGLGIPVIPTGDQLTDLQNGLIGYLNASLGQTLVPANAAQSQDSVCRGACEILELVLGPLNLSLLGLNVSLDDCNGGPVQVCISADRGGLLGNLLCGLSHADIINLTLSDVAQLIRRTQALLADGRLSQRDIAELTALLGRLIR